jgi:hypothetical protein
MRSRGLRIVRDLSPRSFYAFGVVIIGAGIAGDRGINVTIYEFYSFSPNAI